MFQPVDNSPSQQSLLGICIDDEDVECTDYNINPTLLQTGSGTSSILSLFIYLYAYLF